MRRRGDEARCRHGGRTRGLVQAIGQPRCPLGGQSLSSQTDCFEKSDYAWQTLSYSALISMVEDHCRVQRTTASEGAKEANKKNQQMANNVQYPRKNVKRTTKERNPTTNRPTRTQKKTVLNCETIKGIVKGTRGKNGPSRMERPLKRHS